MPLFCVSFQFEMSKRKDIVNKKGLLVAQVARQAKLHSSSEIWCNLCYTAIKLDHGGINQVNQHVQSQLHKTKSYVKFSEKQATLHSLKGAVTLTKVVELRRTEVEALQAFKKAEEDFSFASCDKSFYALRHRVGPVVEKELVKDNTSENLYT